MSLSKRASNDIDQATSDGACQTLADGSLQTAMPPSSVPQLIKSEQSSPPLQSAAVDPLNLVRIVGVATDDARVHDNLYALSMTMIISFHVTSVLRHGGSGDFGVDAWRNVDNTRALESDHFGWAFLLSGIRHPPQPQNLFFGPTFFFGQRMP